MYSGAIVLATSMGGKPRVIPSFRSCAMLILIFNSLVLLQVRALALFENQKRILLAICAVDAISFVLFLLAITILGGQCSFGRYACVLT